MQQAGPAVGEDDVVVRPQDVQRVTVVGLAERLRHRGILLAGQHLEPARRLEVWTRDVGVAPDRRDRRAACARSNGSAWCPVHQRAEVGVGVDRDHPVTADRGEGGAEADGRRGLPDAALQREDGDSIVAADRLVHPVDERAIGEVGAGFARVDAAARGVVDGAPPAAAGGRFARRSRSRSSIGERAGLIDRGWGAPAGRAGSRPPEREPHDLAVPPFRLVVVRCVVQPRR